MMENTGVSSGTEVSAPVIWCGYLGTDGLQHAIIKEEFDFMDQFIWPADCPLLLVPIAKGERMRFKAFPAGEVPNCWKDAREVIEATQ